MIIALFNDTWELVGSIPEDLNLVGEEGLDIPESVSQVIERLQKEASAQLNEPVKDEHGCVVGFKSVEKGEVRYIDAVRDTLVRAGVKAFIVDEQLLDPLRWANKDTSAEVRGQIIPEVVGLDPDTAAAALTAITEKK